MPRLDVILLVLLLNRLPTSWSSITTILFKTLLAGTATMAVSISAYAQDLFSGMLLEDQVAANQVHLDGQIRSRQVKIDRTMSAKLFDKKASAETINMSLFPGTQIKLNRTDFDRNMGEGTRNWSGRVEGFEDGFATLVRLEEGRVIGHVQYGGDTFRITPKDNGVHVISELSLDHLPDEEPLLIFPEEDAKFKNVKLEKSPSAFSPRIQLLVFYTPAAATEVKNAGGVPREEAVLAMAMANMTYANTGMRGQRLKFAGFRSTYCNYDEDGGASGYVQPIYDIVNPSHCIGARAAVVRNSTSADMVALVRKSGGGCGAAIYATYPGNPNEAFSMTSRNCIPGNTFTHELGHNMGLTHDRVTTNSVGTKQDFYNYGIAAPDAAIPIRTVMSYNNPCLVVGKSCTRVPVFSNMRAGADWGGTRLGRGLHQTDAAVSRKRLLETWDIIAGYR